MRDLSQRVLLVHELAQSVRTEVRVDNAGNSLGVDQVGRREHLRVANVHSLTDSTCHTCQTYTELVVDLLTYGTNTTVRQVVDIVHLRVGVDELNEELDDLNHIFLGQHTRLHRDAHIQLVVDTVTANLAQVITLVREEEVHNRLASRCIISRLGVTNLAVDVQHSLFLRTGGITLQGVEQNGVIALAVALLVEQNGFCAGLNDAVEHLLVDLRLTLYNHFVTLDGYHLGGILVHEVFRPSLHHVTCQTATDHLLLGGRSNLHLLSQVEAIKDILVALETYSAKQCGNRQFFLTVDVRIHHVVDVRRKLDPRTAERDDTS